MPQDRFRFDPQHLTASVPGREVVDTAFAGLHSCGRAEEVYPPDGTCGRRRIRGESATPPAGKPLTVTQPTPRYGYITQ
jgi:hypothetical protein